MPMFKGVVHLSIKVPVEVEAKDLDQAQWLMGSDCNTCLSDFLGRYLDPILEAEECSCYRSTQECVIMEPIDTPRPPNHFHLIYDWKNGEPCSKCGCVNDNRRKHCKAKTT